MKSVEFVSAQNVKVEYEYATVIQRTTATIIDATTVAVYLIIMMIIIRGIDSKFVLLWELIIMMINSQRSTNFESIPRMIIIIMIKYTATVVASIIVAVVR